MFGAMSATIEDSVSLQPMPGNAASTVVAGRSERVDGALEAVENMRLPVENDLESFVVFIPAYFTRHQVSPPSHWLDSSPSRHAAEKACR
jgi:hypothetical protein